MSISSVKPPTPSAASPDASVSLGHIRLRPASRQDAAALLAFKIIVLAETEFLLQGPEDISGQVHEERKLIDSFLQHPGCRLLLAWDGAEVIGMCTSVAGSLARSRHVAQTGMAVRRSHWRRGVASALLEESIRWARDDAGLHKLSLQVHAENQPARQLYERHGFAYEGRLREEALLDGRFVDLLAMGRFLT